MNETPARIAPLVSIPQAPLPDWPQGWYVVARSRELAPGRLRTVSLAGRQVVVFRGRSGRLGAVDSRCPHMGAHLRHGEVRGDEIMCPLHGWRIGCDGRVTGHAKRTTAWTVREHGGLVMLEFGGERAMPKVGEPDFLWTDITPIDIGAHWHALTTNAFDMPHLSTVHGRELAEPPQVSFEAGHHFEMYYVTRVRGRGASDLLMKWLTGNRVRARMRCHGPVVVVETDLGWTRTAAVVGMLPTEKGTRLFGAFGIRPGPLGALRLWLTKWLFAAFLKRDLKLVEGMQLRTDVDDAILQKFFDYLRTLRGHGAGP